ncbi:MAG: hypothetical protein AAF823_08275 [Planctomycetota bacterium]
MHRFVHPLLTVLLTVWWTLRGLLGGLHRTAGVVVGVLVVGVVHARR